MSVVQILDRVTEWAQNAICSKITLKVPPDDDAAPTDEGYEHTRVNPTAFTLFVPTKEKLPPSVISPMPSVCVRFLEGSDDLSDGSGSIGIQLCFSAFNPGTHSADVFLPQEGEKNRFRQWRGPEADATFIRNSGGWRDIWNFVDIALSEVESVTEISGYRIDRSTPVKFGPLSEQEAIPDFYPFWFAWVSFSLSYPITRNVRGFENLL